MANHGYVFFCGVSNGLQKKHKFVRKMKQMNLLSLTMPKGINKLALVDCSKPPSLNHYIVMRDGGLERPWDLPHRLYHLQLELGADKTNTDQCLLYRQ